VSATANGSLSATWTVSSDSANSALEVEAMGVTSGEMVVATFTDATTQGLVNGGFEQGLSGWTTNVGSGTGSSVSVVTSYNAIVVSGPPITYFPKEGSHFAVVQTGSYTTLLSQPFFASAGQTISGWAFFDAGDYLPYNDNGSVQILSSGGSAVATPFSSSVSQVGDYGQTPWTSWQYTFTASGTYTIQAQASNYGDYSVQSYLGLDGLTLGAGSQPPVANNDSFTVNENHTLTVTGLGVLANDTDAAGNPLTATLVSQAAHGTVSLNSGGSFTYVPAANFFGTDSFTYKANDGT
jgi:hypothetical protein